MPHIYTPLVSKETFDKVQAIFTNNGNRNRNNTPEFAKTPYIFRGLIYCKECGGLITPEYHKKKNGQEYIYLRCGHPNKICSQNLVNETVIINQLKNEVLDKISLPPTLQEVLKKQLLKELNDTALFNKTIKTKLTNEINELKAKEERLLDFYLEQKVTPNLYEKQAAIIAKQIKELETNAEKYKLIDAKQKENLVKVMSTAINIFDIFDKASVTKKSEILKILLSDCKLNGKKLEYTLNKPFDMLISCPSPKNLPTLIVSNLDVFDALNVC